MGVTPGYGTRGRPEAEGLPTGGNTALQPGTTPGLPRRQAPLLLSLSRLPADLHGPSLPVMGVSWVAGRDARRVPRSRSRRAVVRPVPHGGRGTPRAPGHARGGGGNLRSSRTRSAIRPGVGAGGDVTGEDGRSRYPGVVPNRGGRGRGTGEPRDDRPPTASLGDPSSPEADPERGPTRPGPHRATEVRHSNGQGCGTMRGRVRPARLRLITRIWLCANLGDDDPRVCCTMAMMSGQGSARWGIVRWSGQFRLSPCHKGENSRHQDRCRAENLPHNDDFDHHVFVEIAARTLTPFS